MLAETTHFSQPRLPEDSHVKVRMAVGDCKAPVRAVPAAASSGSSEYYYDYDDSEDGDAAALPLLMRNPSTVRCPRCQRARTRRNPSTVRRLMGNPSAVRSPRCQRARTIRIPSAIRSPRCRRARSVRPTGAARRRLRRRPIEVRCRGVQASRGRPLDAPAPAALARATRGIGAAGAPPHGPVRGLGTAIAAAGACANTSETPYWAKPVIYNECHAGSATST